MYIYNNLIIMDYQNTLNLPKLEDSLFFKKQILGALLDEIQISPLKQNLLFDSTVIDSLSNKVLIEQQLQQTIIIPYQEIIQGTYTQNWESFNLKNNESSIAQKYQHLPKKYFDKNYIRQFITCNIHQLINDKNKSEVVYFKCFQAQKCDQKTFLVNNYKLVKFNQQIKITPLKQQQISVFNNVRLSKIMLLNGLKISGLYLSMNLEKNLNIIVHSHAKSQNYTLRQITTQQHLQQEYQLSTLLQQIIVSQYCWRQQLKFLKLQKNVETRLYFIEMENKNGLENSTIICPKQYRLQIKGSFKKFDKFNIQSLICIMDVMNYFYYQLSISIGNMKYAVILLQQQQSVPVFMDFTQSREANQDLFCYDIAIIMNAISSINFSEANTKSEQITVYIQDILATGNPTQLISKYLKFHNFLKIKQQTNI